MDGRARRWVSGLAPLALTVFALLTLPGLASAAAPVAGAAAVARAAQVGGVSGTEKLQLRLPLNADYAGLRKFATAVTTPGSPEYGQYESIADLARRFGISAGGRRQILRYLRGVGATGVSIDATGLFADATLSAGQAQRLFSTDLARFKATATAPIAAHGAQFIAPTNQTKLPAGLRGLATGVVGLDTRPIATAPALSAATQRSGYGTATGTQAGCSDGLATGGFTPNQYLTAYNYGPIQTAGMLGQGERVALIEIDGFRPADILAFARCFGLPAPHVTQFGVGVKQPLKPGGESTLDLEVLTATAPALTGIDVYESSADATSTLKALTAPLQNSGFKPQVISASLGLCEPFTLEAVKRAGINATEGALQEAAASGISFLASSGDAGSADCTTQGEPVDRLAVNYPSSSSWVTGVGGTNLVLSSSNLILAQPVWNDADGIPGAAGGGGASILFNRPGYQNGTVVQNHRAVPDVSMLADIGPGYAIYCTARPDCTSGGSPGGWQTVGGTSAATPLLAGGFAEVDQWLRTHARQDLGLANPLLYKFGRTPSIAPSVFSDVISGSNDVGPFIAGGGRPLGCCSAKAGFDMASGWGSVNLYNFSNFAILSQPAIVDVGLQVPRKQSPVKARQINATVSCTGKCLMGAYATISVGTAKPYQTFSSLVHLPRKGRRAVAIKLSPARLRAIAAALRSHQRVSATIVGAIVDAAGNIEKQTAGRPLAIRN